MEDKRRFPRFPASFQIKYYPASDDARVDYTIANDISRGGLSMPALSGIAKNNDIIKMCIDQRDGEGSILATGRVRWTNKRKRKALLDEDAGIEFIDIAPTDIDRLIKAR
ncbi:MAG: PilZ domain-containing protein [Candidatus Omnitrophica bacterium]|nr:PilZ domain-containing protein [Candidatus Omnitrophota bacterium]MDD5437402.1 PilZ domain-containing protein [Candidatus Omnitrophota bacterium]